MNKITRRQALGTTAGALTVLGLTAAATSVATSAAATPAAAPTPPGTVDEVYQGRRIQITTGGGGHHGGHHSPGQPTVRIDGRELHIMRNADGSWISVINHYETFTEPKLLARAAVRDLQGAPLVPFGGAA
ncbi:tyrosinase cofactor [Streptomyces erythrochromogenes]|uniref:apotyrosinase chaperone MelC1 n=1 Tax=Streptomyces erythrochromogenes TaxID=285574 RepID=UPI0002E0435E|nr:tyrosinase cofactor [Streptomyces erythrochromogenes]